MGSQNADKSSTEDESKTLLRSFVFVILDQLPHENATTIIRKVAILEVSHVMKNGMMAVDPNANITLAEHALGVKPSQFLSFSDNPLGSPTNALTNTRGEPILVDVRKMKKNGLQFFSPEEIVADLRKYAQRNPKSLHRVQKLIKMIMTIEREALVKGHIKNDLLKKPTKSHNAFINQAEEITRKLQKHRNLAKTQNEIASLKSSYKKARITGSIFRLVNVAGIVLTVGDITYSSHQSVKQRSARPIIAETIRQSGGWGLGWAGFKTGCAAGAIFGIETGPGAFVTCAIGGMIFGVGGYIFADWLADPIYENEPGIPWMDSKNW